MHWLHSPNLKTTHGFSTRHGGVSPKPFDSLNLGGTDDLPENITQNRQRALLNSMYKMYQEYPDNCNTSVGSRLGKFDDEKVTEINTTFDAVLFPNPGVGNFSMATFGLTEGELEVSINDVTGKIVYQNKQQVINALTTFDIDVKSGVYFVRIAKPDTKEILIKKLVIQK